MEVAWPEFAELVFDSPPTCAVPVAAALDVVDWGPSPLVVKAELNEPPCDNVCVCVAESSVVVLLIFQCKKIRVRMRNQRYSGFVPRIRA